LAKQALPLTAGRARTIAYGRRSVLSVQARPGDSVGWRGGKDAGLLARRGLCGVVAACLAGASEANAVYAGAPRARARDIADQVCASSTSMCSSIRSGVWASGRALPLGRKPHRR
jgi:hypothetical protein